MPDTGVYFVSPRSIAAFAAALMWSGVSKSGSPAASEITSRPLAFSSRAFGVMAMVAEGFTGDRTSARKGMGRLRDYGTKAGRTLVRDRSLGNPKPQWREYAKAWNSPSADAIGHGRPFCAHHSCSLGNRAQSARRQSC